jgi:hypothetical protein
MKKVIKPIKVNVGEVILNPNNPRTIKDKQFKKLVQSIKDFPEMLEMRPIVVDESMVILGGNMRFRASLEAGVKEVFILRADDLSEAQKQEFIIKDNASFGEWDWDILANSFNDTQLNEWGLNVWSADDLDFGNDTPEDNENADESEEHPSGQVNVQDRPIEHEKVIQIEFLITDYNEAFGVAGILRKHGVNIGEILIQTMKKALQDGN